MAKTAVLMPYPELKELAESMLHRYSRLFPMCVEYVNTDRIAARAKELENAGCDLIVARGLQARIVREAVLIPVVEMRSSTQELESLVLALRESIPAGNTPPRLGIIGFFNMFHSTAQFNRLLDVDLRIYTATDIDQYGHLVNRAFDDGCAGVIGGEVVGQRARELGLSFRFLSMGEESMRETLESASLLGYSIDLNKRSNAAMSVMLDNTFSAILQLDETGNVRRANRAFYYLLGSEPGQVIGRPATAVLESMPAEELDGVLRDGREADGVLLTIRGTSVIMSAIPIRVEERVTGAILTFQEGKRISEMDTRLRQELARQGYVAKYHFNQMFARNPSYQRVLNQARRLSRYPSAVLLSGESGVGKGLLAECIHNESLQRNGAFITVDCSIWHPDDLDEKLFGRFSARKDNELSIVEQARGGTLYLRQVEKLSLETQYKLLQLVHGKFIHNGLSQSLPIDLKLILSTETSLRERMQQGLFRKDLYYSLSAFKLDIPPLRGRPEDLSDWFQSILQKWSSSYGRQIVLSPDAVSFIAAYDWPGNLDQMNSVCQRLVVLSEKRTVNDVALRQHLMNMGSEPSQSADSNAHARDARALELLELLNRCHGNREKAAAELGISKTTLWRRMKKYGIARDLSME